MSVSVAMPPCRSPCLVDLPTPGTVGALLESIEAALPLSDPVDHYRVVFIAATGEQTVLSHPDAGSAAGGSTRLDELGIVGVEERVELSLTGRQLARARLDRRGWASARRVGDEFAALLEGGGESAVLEDAARRADVLEWVEMIGLAQVAADGVLVNILHAALCAAAATRRSGAITFLMQCCGILRARDDTAAAAWQGLIDTPAADGDTPIHTSARHGAAQALSALLAHGGDVNAVGRDGEAPLHAAVAARCDACARVLVTHGADVDKTDASGLAPLHCAAAHGCGRLARLLLNHAAAPDAADVSGQTALHVAAQAGHTLVLRLVLAAGADPNAADRSGQTPLAHAAAAGAVGAVRALLSHGTAPDTPDLLGRTPLHMAATYGDAESVQALLAGGASAAVSDLCGMIPHAHAEMYGHDAAARALTLPPVRAP